MMSPWRYCPECGSTINRVLLDCGQENHYQCEKCYQEWFSDVDYSECVSANLGILHTENERLETALKTALEKIELSMTNTDKLQAIYDAEQNIQLSWFWDSGVHAVIGDRVNGFKEQKTFERVADAIDWLYENTVTKLPADRER